MRFGKLTGVALTVAVCAFAVGVVLIRDDKGGQPRSTVIADYFGVPCRIECQREQATDVFLGRVVSRAAGTPVVVPYFFDTRTTRQVPATLYTVEVLRAIWGSAKARVVVHQSGIVDDIGLGSSEDPPLLEPGEVAVFATTGDSDAGWYELVGGRLGHHLVANGVAGAVAMAKLEFELGTPVPHVAGRLGVVDPSDRFVWNGRPYLRVVPAFGAGTPEADAFPPTGESYAFVPIGAESPGSYLERAGKRISFSVGTGVYSVGICDLDYRVVLALPGEIPAFYEAEWARSVTTLGDRHPLGEPIEEVTISHYADGEEFRVTIRAPTIVAHVVYLAQSAPYAPDRLGTGPLSCAAETQSPYDIRFCGGPSCLSGNAVAVRWFAGTNVFADGFAPASVFEELVMREFQRAEPVPNPQFS